MPIQVLDPTVAAQIAAGEVVERPASVAKELIENAIDAGATRILVEARGGGLRELRVQDNGCGIPAHELELAFERHATSKLRAADDLWDIHTLGFRGEALPSIASVAQVICTTRAEGEQVGTELRIAGGEVQSRGACGCSRGTTFSVRNLFYNVPVRRDFLRSEATEASQIASVATQYALAYPEISMTLLLDGRLIFRTNGGGDLREALIDLYGVELARQLLPVEASFGSGAESVEVRGMVSPPGVTRSSRGYLHLFVNRRAIQARGQIVFAIEEAYHTLLMKGRHPLAVLDLRVHPGSVDVNVHPTKGEVKFRDSVRVYGVLSRAVREALVSGGEVRPWDSAAAPALPGESAQRRFELRRLGGYDERADPEPGWKDDRRRDGPAAPVDSWLDLPDQPRAAPPAGLFDDEAPAAAPPAPAAPRLPPLRVVGQVGQTYIVAESPEGMYLVDQHAAHERITYERLMAAHGSNPIESQGLLLPQTVELPPAAQQTLLDNADELAAWGFVLEDFGTSLRVRAVPSGMRENDLATALLEIVDHLGGRGGSTPLDWREAMLTTLSCHSSIRAGQTLSLTEMREMILQLEQCEAPRTCPHGRPTMILLNTSQIERQFGRIK